MTTRTIDQILPANYPVGIFPLDYGGPIPDTIACVVMDVYGMSGTMIPQYVMDNSGYLPGTPTYRNTAYGNVPVPTTVYAAGSTITVDGTYELPTDGGNVVMNVTVSPTADVVLRVRLLQGPANLGSGGGTSVIATAAAPTYSEGASVALSTDLSGVLRTSATLSGGAADNSTNSTTKLPVLPGTATAAAPSWIEGRQVPLSTDLAGNIRVITTASAGAADNSTNSTTKAPVLDGTATAAAPSYTEGRQVPRSSDLAGNTRVIPAATEVHVGQVGGTTTNIAPTLAVTAAAYSANNCVGGLLTLTSAMRTSGNSGAWAKLTITDHANQKAALDVLLFKSTPAGTFTDKSAFPTLSAADNALVSARISIATTDWVTMGGSAYCTKVVGPLPVTASGSANLFAAMQTSGTPTYAVTTDLNAIFGFFCD